MTNIVMLCHNRHRLLEQSLRSLAVNTPQGDYNLTLVDDESTDYRVHGLLLQWAQRPNCTLLRVSHSNHVLGQLKNLGVSWSEQCFDRHDWLYLSDSDVYFTENWLKKLTKVAECAEMRDFHLIGGQVHPYHVTLTTLRWTSDIGATKMAWDEVSVLDGPSWMMRWKIWTQVGGLSRHCAPGVCQSEEYRFCEVVQAMGGRIAAVYPHLVLHTGLTNTDGNLAPGWDKRAKENVLGVLYE